MAADIVDSRNPNRVSHLTGIFKIVNLTVTDGVNTKSMQVYIDTTFPSYVHKQTSGNIDNSLSLNYVVSKNNEYRYLLKLFSPVFNNPAQRIDNSYPNLTTWHLKRNSSILPTEEFGENVILQTKAVYGSTILANPAKLDPIQGQLDIVYELIPVVSPTFRLTYPFDTERPPVNNTTTETFVPE